MEFAALAARIDRRREIGEQRRVEVAPGESRVEHLRIDAREPRLQAAGDHVARERRGVGAEQREDRRQPGAGQFLFAIAPDVLEKQIAERHVREAFGDGACDGGRHRALVDLVGTRRRNRHLPQRQPKRVRLRLEQRSTRTACIATRCVVSLIVVSTPASSMSGCCRSTCTIHALSLPLDHETNILHRIHFK